MGTIKFFSSSSYDCDKQEYINSTPNPEDFNILKIRNKYTKNLAVKIQYPSVSNYEGVKILVYKNLSKSEFLSFVSVDPHFSDNTYFKSPYARFEPTKEGWKSALRLLKTLN